MNNKLREYRKKNNLTLEELKKKIKKLGFIFSRDALSKYERGQRNPSENKWKQLAKFYKVDVSELQGNPLSEGSIEERMVKLIHQAFFNKNNQVKLQTSIIIFLNITGQAKVPDSFYSTKDEQRPLKTTIKKFWYSCFNKIISKLSYSVNSDISDRNLTDLLNSEILGMVNEEAMKSYPKKYLLLITYFLKYLINAHPDLDLNIPNILSSLEVKADLKDIEPYLKELPNNDKDNDPIDYFAKTIKLSSEMLNQKNQSVK